MCAPDAPAMWRASPLAGTVDVEVFSCDVGLRKPDPEIYLLATERLGVEPAGVPVRGRRLVPRALGRGGRRDATGADPRPQEEAEMLRPEVEAWDGASIDDLRRIPDLLEA